MSSLVKYGIIAPIAVTAIACLFGATQKTTLQEKTDAVTNLKNELATKQREWPQLEQEGKQKLADIESAIQGLETEIVQATTRFAAHKSKAHGFNLSDFQIDALAALPSTSEIQTRIQTLARRHLPTDDRPYSGHILFNRTGMSQFGNGHLELENGLDEDAYVKLRYGNRAIAGFYVRSNSTFKFCGIPKATFNVIFATGFGWDSSAFDFRRGRRAERYDDDFNYRLYEGFSITLHKVQFGTATTTPISPSQFDSYQ